MNKVSRRGFLKGAAMGAAGLAASAAAGAALASESPAQSFDMEAEIVVVGTGTAITAAIAAAELGAASVIVLEKDPDIFGGTSVTSGGGYSLPGTVEDLRAEGIEDTREEVLTYMKNVGEGRMDDRAMTAFVDNANDYVQWVKGVFGWSKFGHGNKAFGDYYELYEGSLPDGYGRGNCNPFDAEGNMLRAGAQWAAFQNYVENSDRIELMMGTAATGLIVDEAGAVIGVYAQRGGEAMAIRALKGVVLGTGGFDHNEDMRRYYLPFPIMRTCASRNNTGDAQRMGAKIGGQLAFMDRVMGVPFYLDSLEWGKDDDRDYSLMSSGNTMDWCNFVNLPHSVCVNRKGKRFTNENRFYDTFCRAFSAYDTGLMKYENIPAFWICDSDYASRFLLPGRSTVDALPAYIVQGESLAEIAEKMEIDREGLETEMARFNENARQGIDPDWHRGESVNQLNTALGNAGYMTLNPEAAAEFTDAASLLGTVEKPPFYCVRYVPGSCNTRGGLLVDGDGAVVDMEGNAISGLYAVGCCSTGVAGYWAGGSCLSQGCVMSYVAVKHMLGLA